MSIDNGRARVISIISGKGGVGKTTLVSNLGVLLARTFGKRVLAVDANITTANLGIHMGLQSAPATLHDILEDNLPVENAMYGAFGVDVIPASPSIGDERALKFLRPKLTPFLPRYNFVLLDSSPGLGLEARLALSMADELLLVTNPELSAVTEVIKMAEFARKKNIPVLGIVLNKVTGHDYEIRTPDIEKACGLNVIAEIPDDRNVPKSISLRTPVVLYNSRCPAARSMENLAALLIGEKRRRRSVAAWLLDALKMIWLLLTGRGAAGGFSGKNNKLPEPMPQPSISQHPQQLFQQPPHPQPQQLFQQPPHPQQFQQQLPPLPLQQFQQPLPHPQQFQQPPHPQPQQLFQQPPQQFQQQPQPFQQPLERESIGTLVPSSAEESKEATATATTPTPTPTASNDKRREQRSGGDPDGVGGVIE